MPATYERLQGMRAYVWEQRYDVLSVSEAPPHAFAVVRDINGVTAVMEQGTYRNDIVRKADLSWRIITLDAVLPFGMVGVLAQIATWLADVGIPLYVVSSFETDHFLVKEQDLQGAVRTLKSHGIAVT
jgi:hypothetical protein